MSSESIPELIAAVRREADAAEFPIDEPVYQRAGTRPQGPILFAGTLEAPVCVVGRDLGKDEVAAGQPLDRRRRATGPARRPGGLGQAEGAAANRPRTTRRFRRRLEHALLTNTVPYKPPGNKAYAESVRRTVPPLPRTTAGSALAGPHLITLGHRGVPVVRALRRPGRVPPAGSPSTGSSRPSIAGSPTASRRRPSRRSSSFPCRTPRPSTADGTTSFPPCSPTASPKSARN